MKMRLSIQSRELTDRQQGILARWQVAGRVPDLAAIDGLLRAGRWQTLYRGVYATYTGRPSRATKLWAGVLRCGPDAVLSHFTAAELDRITDDPSQAIYVSIPQTTRIRVAPTEFRGRLPGIVLHRSPRVASARHPARMPPRTRVEETVLDLTDLARTFDAAFAWLSAACGRRLITPDQIRDAATKRARLRWRADVMGALEEITDGVLSNLERHYLRNVQRPHGLPEPRRQAHGERRGRSAYLDNLYEEFGLAVELDGLASHQAETRWDDIHRDNHFAGAGIITLRYNWADVTQRPCQVAAEIALTLRRRGWTGTLRSCRSCSVALAS
jgi:hypothetical protein